MRLLITFLIVVTGLLSASQDSTSAGINYYPAVIDSIIIKGTQITEDYIIIRELDFKIGDSITYEKILFNRDRIFSLGIFNRVDIFILDENGRNNLVIDVEESWYIYPLPFAELKDKSWDKVSYGVDVFVKNFRGRNETLRLRGALGYDPSIFLNYTVPSLTNDGNYYLYTDLYYRDIRNKSKYALSLSGENFDQKMILANLGIGRRFGIYHRLSLQAGFTYIENPVFIPGISASNERIDRFPSMGVGYSYDSRDLIQFPNKGVYLNAAIVAKGFGSNGINYQIANIDFREYQPIVENLSAKWRFAGRFGFGELIPTHDYSYIGFGERIRGFYAEELEGHHLYLASAELYYPLIKEMRVNLDFIPLIPKELLHYRAGLYIQLFTDSGTTTLKNSKISFNDFKTGYGTGVTVLILPYNILRVEFAVSEDGATEWILDLGISF